MQGFLRGLGVVSHMMRTMPAGRFADANATLDEARYVVLGVPFDRTTSFRPGARFGPDAIRAHSWNFETFDLETSVDLSEVPVHDAGNLEEFGNAPDMAEALRTSLAPLWKAGKFPIVLGGDHACAAPVVEAIPEDRKVFVIYLDAHMDFREEYLGDPRSHACSSRRMAEHVGFENLAVLGVRSVSQEEKEGIQKTGLRYIDAYQVHRAGMDAAIQKVLKMAGKKDIYISLDIDCIDPAYAGGTGTPEPFGLSPLDIKAVVDRVGRRLIGMDFMEVSPPYDNGNTSALAARLAREAIVRSWKK